MPRKRQVRCRTHLLGKFHGVLDRSHAAATHHGVDLDDHAERRVEGAGAGGEPFDLDFVVDGDGRFYPLRERRQPQDLVGVDHLVGDEHVAGAVVDEHLRLGDLGGAYAPHRAAGGDLHAEDLWRLVVLAVGAQSESSCRGSAQR